MARHVTGSDPLALPSSDYDPTVIADAALEALERVWGEEDTDTKPTLQRVLIATLTALCELKLTLAEARLLFDPNDRAGIRRWAIENLGDEEAREEIDAAWAEEVQRRIAAYEAGEMKATPGDVVLKRLMARKR